MAHLRAGVVLSIRRSAGASGACLPDIARSLARGTAAGLPLGDAFQRGADAVDGEGGSVMRRCADELRAGHPSRVALASLERVDGGRLLVGAIELHLELGGDLVASLNGLAEGLADRERLRLEAHAATAQARIAARIVPVAPLASLVMLVAIAPASAHALVASAPGLAIIGVSATLTGIAVLVLRRIARGAGL
ncbi:MAG: type II secretion system F family protein [Gaiellales bacterium]